jgi:hypothetical protein
MRDFVTKWAGAGLALMLGVYVLGTDAFASVSTPAVPEISPGSLSAGVALLAAGILVLRARRRSK